MESPTVSESQVFMFYAFILIIMMVLGILRYIYEHNQPPTELGLETHQNHHPQPMTQQDIETGHLTPPHPQQDIKTGYMMQIEKIEFKGIEEEGFDQICCSICLEEFEDGHDIIRIKMCRHVFHRLCIDSWLKQNQSCPNCRCF
ncbi:hypothetical protein ARALYDRAFT_910187 [Arabidopsis lyrata subsp. lyrata]|uniref:RING-type E3 ubiquitin transferase n=1 Tax=Arabidopsis lyrata subsp. lyrata TaxID=81972 RepID=D7M0T1_ARALL|nr:hypothetical protein ARALYDRAFT_910187 [Arabidopsis lyrata subsp. lyrata]